MEMTQDSATRALLKAMDLHSAAELGKISSGAKFFVFVIFRKNDIEACNMAIESGAELDLPHPRNGFTPLQTAIEKGHHDLAVVLLEGNFVARDGDESWAGWDSAAWLLHTTERRGFQSWDTHHFVE